MTQRSSTEIAADLAVYRSARTALVAGERVKEVWRDGRRMIFDGITLNQIERAIATLEREYEAALSIEDGRPKRRAIGLAWRN